MITKLPNERGRSFTDYHEKVHKVLVLVVVDFEAISLRFSKKYSSRTAERFDVPVIVPRKNRVENF